MIENKIRQSFDRAAKNYDQFSNFQFENGLSLFNQVDTTLFEKNSLCLDLGCGTGRHLDLFASNNVQCHWVGVDNALNMLFLAKEKHKQANLQWVHADAAHLPFEKNIFSFIFSNFVLQWSPDIELVFKNIFSLLKKNGCFSFSLPVEGTFPELEASWKKVDSYAHIQSFYQKDFLLACLGRVGFQIIHSNVENRILNYQNFYEFAQSVKWVGASNKNENRRKTLTGKTAFKKMLLEYETLRPKNAGFIPATYCVFRAIVRKPISFY
jgi:malonyl-CoA O-methyltransferase